MPMMGSLFGGAFLGGPLPKLGDFNAHREFMQQTQMGQQTQPKISDQEGQNSEIGQGGTRADENQHKPKQKAPSTAEQSLGQDRNQQATLQQHSRPQQAQIQQLEEQTQHRGQESGDHVEKSPEKAANSAKQHDMLPVTDEGSIFSQSISAMVFSKDDPSPQEQEGKEEAGLGTDLKKPPATGSEESKLPENGPGGDFPPPIQSLFSIDLPALAAQGRATREDGIPTNSTASAPPGNQAQSSKVAQRKDPLNNQHYQVKHHLSSLETSAKNYLLQLEENDEQQTLGDKKANPTNPGQDAQATAYKKSNEHDNSNIPEKAHSMTTAIPKASFFTSQPGIYRRDSKQESSPESIDQSQGNLSKIKTKHKTEDESNQKISQSQTSDNLDAFKQQEYNNMFPSNMFNLAVGQARGGPGSAKSPIVLPDPSQIILSQKGGIHGIQVPPSAGSKPTPFTSFNSDLPGLSRLPGIPDLKSSFSGQTGEIIATTYHTYNSIGIGSLAPLVQQDENLSLTLHSKNVKIFFNPDQSAKAKNLICFIEHNSSIQGHVDKNYHPQNWQNQGASAAQSTGKVVEVSNNISFLVNQDDQIPNILSGYHSKSKLLGTILDFTVRQFRYLYLLYAKSIAILDFKDLLSSQVDSSAHDIQIVESIQLFPPPSAGGKAPQSMPSAGPNSTSTNNLCQFTRIEVANSDDSSLLLFTDIASRRNHGLAFPVSSVPSAAPGKTKEDGQSVTLSDQIRKAAVSQSRCEILHIDCSNFKGSHSASLGQQSSGGASGSSGEHHHVRTLLQFGAQKAGDHHEGSRAGQASSTNEQVAPGRILDIEIWDTYLAVLFEKNLVMIYDLAESCQNQYDSKSAKPPRQGNISKLQFEKPIFKAYFADATESISQIFFIQDFSKFDNEEENNPFNEAEMSRDSEKEVKPSEKRLTGHFLLVETKSLLPKLSSLQLKEVSKKTFRKLHIVSINDPIGPLYLVEQKISSNSGNSRSTKSLNQSLDQIDQLTFAEQASKFVNFDAKRGIVFMLNQEKQDRHMKFFSITLKKEILEDSDSDDGVGVRGVMGSNKDRAMINQRIRFEYITEVRFQISNQSFSAIQKFSQSKHKQSIQQPLPVYLNLLCIGGEEPATPGGTTTHSYDSEQFFVYINILDQVLVFRRSISELRPSSQDMIQMIRTGSAHKQQSQVSQSATSQQQMLPKEGILDLSKLVQLPNAYKEKILRNSKQMMDDNYPDRDEGESDLLGYRNNEIDTMDNQQLLNNEQADKEKNSQELIEDGGEHIVKDLLDADSDKSQKQSPSPTSNKSQSQILDQQQLQQRGDAILQRIDQECREEEQREAEILQKNIEEATKDIFSTGDDVELQGELKQDNFGNENGTGIVIQQVDSSIWKQDEKDKPQEYKERRGAASGSRNQSQASRNQSKSKTFKYVIKEKSPAKANESGDQDEQNQQIKTTNLNNNGKKPSKKVAAQALKKSKKPAGGHDNPSHLQEKSSMPNPTPQANNTNKNKQRQQEQIVENFTELTRKYQDLAQRMNQLQQQVQRQNQQKIDLENAIKKAVKECISSQVTQQVREQMIPLITKKLRGIDEQLNEQVIPKIEEGVEKVMKSLIDRMTDKAKSNGDDVTPAALQQLIKKEFRSCLHSDIKPSLEQCISKLMAQLKGKLDQVDQALCEKLADEEERHESMANHYQNSLTWLKMFHKKLGVMAKDQIKDQMVQQIEQSKVMTREYQSELKSKLQDIVTAQVQAQVQIQVQQQMQVQIQQQIQQQVQQQVQFHLQNSQMQPFQSNFQQSQFGQQPLLTHQHSQATLSSMPQLINTANQKFQQNTSFVNQIPPSAIITPQHQPNQIIANQAQSILNYSHTDIDQQADSDTQALLRQMHDIKTQLQMKQQLSQQQPINLMKQSSSSKKSQLNISTAQHPITTSQFVGADEDPRLQKELRVIDDQSKNFYGSMNKYKQSSIIVNNKPVLIYNDTDEEEASHERSCQRSGQEQSAYMAMISPKQKPISHQILLQQQKQQEKKKQIEESQLRKKSVQVQREQAQEVRRPDHQAEKADKRQGINKQAKASGRVPPTANAQSSLRSLRSLRYDEEIDKLLIGSQTGMRRAYAVDLQNVDLFEELGAPRNEGSEEDKEDVDDADLPSDVELDFREQHELYLKNPDERDGEDPDSEVGDAYANEPRHFVGGGGHQREGSNLRPYDDELDQFIGLSVNNRRGGQGLPAGGAPNMAQNRGAMRLLNNQRSKQQDQQQQQPPIRSAIQNKQQPQRSYNVDRAQNKERALRKFF